MKHRRRSKRYSSWLNAFKTALGLELYQTKLIEGPAHELRIIVGLRVFHPLNDDMNFASEGTSASEKEAIRKASRKMFEQLKMSFNLSDYSIYSNSNNWQKTLSELISIATKPGTFQQVNLDLIGGLCIKTWSDTAAINILNNLYDNMLFSEIRSVYKLWVENNLSEKADLILSSHPNSNELNELVLFGQDVNEDGTKHVAQLELEMEMEQQTEKNQNQQEADEMGEPINSILEEGSGPNKVMVNEQGVEKPIEVVKLDYEIKIEIEETSNVEKNIETTMEGRDKQREINKLIDYPILLNGSQQEVVQNPIKELIKGSNTQVNNIKTVIDNSSSKARGINNEENKKNHQITKNKNAKTIKLYKVHSRIFRFSSEQCPYCGEKLKNYNRIFCVNLMTEAKYLESFVKCCLVCDISGLTDIEITTLTERGFLPLFYQGSPGFFQSTVLTKALSSENIIQISLQEQVSVTDEEIEYDEHLDLDLDEIINVPTKRQRVITPETLTKKLELNNRIGLAGEKYVLVQNPLNK